jgi:hypothetical protein
MTSWERCQPITLSSALFDREAGCDSALHRHCDGARAHPG